MATNIFKPIQQPDNNNRTFYNADSRSSSALSSITDNNRESPIDIAYNANSAKLRSRYSKRHRDASANSKTAPLEPGDPKFLLRRSSSAMRVRELRDVLSDMTATCEEGKGKNEVQVSGSQKARLLVASQQRLVSRLQDLRHELDSMDNEVARVRGDIMSSRRYFSAMTGIPCGPDWPRNSGQSMDSAYTSPMSFMSRSSSVSPYNSDDSIATTTSTTTNPSSSSTPFQSLQHFEDLQQSKSLTRSDSCSSFMSWRSDVELAGVFPEEPVPVHVLPHKKIASYD